MTVTATFNNKISFYKHYPQQMINLIADYYNKKKYNKLSQLK